MNLIRLNTVYANDWLKLDFSNNLNLICSELVHVSDWYVVCRFLWFSLVKVQWKSIPQILFLLQFASFSVSSCAFRFIALALSSIWKPVQKWPQKGSKRMYPSNKQHTQTHSAAFQNKTLVKPTAQHQHQLCAAFLS